MVNAYDVFSNVKYSCDQLNEKKISLSAKWDLKQSHNVHLKFAPQFALVTDDTVKYPCDVIEVVAEFGL